MDFHLSYTAQRIEELRWTERGCLDRISSIRRKLDAGSQAVSDDDLKIWERELQNVRARLVELEKNG